MRNFVDFAGFRGGRGFTFVQRSVMMADMEALLLAVVAGGLLIVAYLTYGRWVARRVFTLREDSPTPAVVLEDGRDYCPTSRSVVFGHHFTSIAGTGPIVGPAIAVMWGWLPAVLWVLFGGVFIGAVHDMGSLVVSLRNKGRTVGDIAGDLLGPRVRLIFLATLALGLWIVLAIFGLVIASVLRQFPAAIFPVLFQIPLAIVIGLLVHRRGGSIVAISILALGLMYASVMFGDASFGPTLGGLHEFNQFLAAQPLWKWTVGLLAYCYIASVLPVWVLLQPRDYINALQLVSALALIVAGLVAAAFFGGPLEVAPGETERIPLEIVAPMVNWQPKGAPPIVPLLFITVACGAISGFHCLVSSGTTSKQLKKETDALPVGYGSMLTESFLAILVIIACVAGLGLGATKELDFGIGGSAGIRGEGDQWIRAANATLFIELPRGTGESYYITSSVTAPSSADLPRYDAPEHRYLRLERFKSDSVQGTGMGSFQRQGARHGTVQLGMTHPMHRTPDSEYFDSETFRTLELDEGGARLLSDGYRMQLDGRLAFLKQYESWNAAGGLASTVGAFVTGSANLVKSLGVPAGMAVALMGVLVASFAGTTMDTACRLNRYVVQELARTFLPKRAPYGCAACGYDLSGAAAGSSELVRCPECAAEHPRAELERPDPHGRVWRAASNLNPFKWLATVHGATIFAVIAAALLAAIPPQGSAWTLANAGKGGMILWPLFGATNQLLGGLAFIVIYAWLRATRRPTWMIVPAAIFMLIVPAWAMIWQAFVGNADAPSWWSTKQWPLLAFAVVVLTLEGLLLIETARRLPRMQRIFEGAGQ